MTRQNKIIAGAAALLLVVLALRSCGSDNTPVPAQAQVQTQVQQPQQVVVQDSPPEIVYEQAPPPQVIYQQAPSSGGITAGHIAAGALGYFAGKSSSNSGYNGNRTVVNKTYINKTYRTAPRSTSRSYYGSSSRRSSSFTRSRSRR